jgi:hypothetical protein
MNNWNIILKDFAHKCGDGGPSMTNSNHLALLRESLIKFGWKENATNEFIGNLREGKELVKEDWWDDKSDTAQAAYIKKYGEAPDVAGDDDKGDDGEDIKDKKGKVTQKEVDVLQDQSIPLNDVPKELKEKKRKDDLNLQALAKQMVKSEEKTSGSGRFTMTKEQIQSFHTFQKERNLQEEEREKYKKENNLQEGDEELKEYDKQNPPYVHPDCEPLVDVTDEQVTEFQGELMEELCGEPKPCPAYTKFKAKVQCSGGPVTNREGGGHRCTGEKGEQRFNDMCKLYMRSRGRCVVTGEQVPFSKIQPDHRQPFSSAAELAEKRGISIEEAEDIIDNPMTNIDLVHENINQFKKEFVGDELMEKLERKINETDDQVELKKLNNQKKNYRNEKLNEFYKDRFRNGDFSDVTEEGLGAMNSDERNALMKAYNYFHPDARQYREQVAKISKEQGKTPEEAEEIYLKDLNKFHDGKFDINETKEHFLVRTPSGGGEVDPENRSRGLRRDKDDEVKYVMEKLGNNDIEVLTEGEQKKQDKASDKAMEQIEKGLNEKQLEIEQVNLRKYEKEGNERQIKRVKNKIDKLKQRNKELEGKEK